MIRVNDSSAVGYHTCKTIVALLLEPSKGTCMTIQSTRRYSNANFRCFIRLSSRGAMKLQKIQSYVKVLQSYSTLCTEKSRVMSRLVNSIIMQIMSYVISVASGVDLCTSALDHCRICPRPSMRQRQSTVGSAPEYCRVCMQKRKILCAEFCRSRAVEETSGIFWIMIELTNLL